MTGPSKKMTIIVNDNVRSCSARGKEYPLGRSFSFMDGCYRYNCECHSDGSWECPGDRAENTCTPDEDRDLTPDYDRTSVHVPSNRSEFYDDSMIHIIFVIIGS